MPKENSVDDIEFLDLGEPTPTQTQDPPIEDDEDEGKDTQQDIEESSDDPDNEEDIQLGDDQQEEDDQGSEDRKETDQPDPDSDQPEDEPEGSDEEEPSLFEDIVQRSGVEFEENEMEEIRQLEETDEGLNEVAARIADKKAEQRLSSLLEQNPHTQRMLEYEMNGGDPEKYYDAYFPENDYSEMEIQEDDVQTQKQVVARSLELQGLDEEDINEQIEDLEAAGILHKNAKRSLKALQKHQEQKQQQIEEERQELAEQRKREAEQQFNNTVEIVREGDIEGIQIPKEKQDEFIEYMYEPVNEQGHSQAQIDANKMGLEQRILMAYLNFSDYNLDGFINNKASNSGKRDLRKAMEKSKSKEGPKSKGKTNKGSGKPEDIVSPFDI